MTPQEKFDFIQGVRFLSFNPIRSSNVPGIGSVVIIGGYTYPKSLTTIKNIQQNGVLLTECGIRFSTKQNEIVSTQKVDGVWLKMFDLEKTYQYACKKVEENHLSHLSERHRTLCRLVEALSPVEDEELIVHLLEILQ